MTEASADRLRELRVLIRALALFQLFDLLFQLLDDFLAEMRALGEFLLNLTMDGDVAIERLDLLLHFVVSEEQLLRLLALVLQLRRQLVVLQYGQTRCRLKLLVVEREQVGLGFLDFEKHLFSELLCGPDLFALHFAELQLLLLLLLVEFVLQLSHLYVVLLLLLAVLDQLVVLDF